MNMKVLLVLSWSTMAVSITLPGLLGQIKLPNFSSILPNFLRSTQSNYSHMCIYSKDPEEYKPRCFLCPDAAYEAIIEACNPEPEQQVNVTYEQAECMEKNCQINFPEGGKIISDMRVKRQAPNATEAKEMRKSNSETGLKLERSRLNLFKISSLPKLNGSYSQMPILDDEHEEGFYEQEPAVKIQNLIVINNTEYIISRQDVFFAMGKNEIYRV